MNLDLAHFIDAILSTRPFPNQSKKSSFRADPSKLRTLIHRATHLLPNRSHKDKSQHGHGIPTSQTSQRSLVNRIQTNDESDICLHPPWVTSKTASNSRARKTIERSSFVDLILYYTKQCVHMLRKSRSHSVNVAIG